MKILVIRIKNLASLEGITEIDFTQEPLCSAGIFAITGPMGAGKSTILDALCLALYEKTPRYKLAENGIEIKDVQGTTINQSDVRGILRDGTADGFAEVDFVGVDGQHYRSTWTVRRARNQSEGRLQDYVVSLKNLSAGADIPGRKTDLLEETERLVGLNLEQFTRSVLLAQGDFTAFLKAGKDEKSSLLEKLTGTQVYSEISSRIFEKYREEAQQLRELNIQREGIPTLTTEELKALAVQKTEFELAKQAQEQLIGELGKEMIWHENLATLHSNLEAEQVQFEQVSTAKKEALPRAQKLHQVERVQTIRSVVDNLLTSRQDLTQKETLYRQQQEKLGGLRKQQQALDQTFEQATIELRNKVQEEEAAHPLLNDAKALDVQLAEKETQVTSATEEVRLAKGSQQQHAQQVLAKQKEVERLEKEIHRLTQWKTENAPRQHVAENESLILSKLNDAAAFLETAQTASTRISAINQNIDQTKLDKEALEKELISIEAALQQARQHYESVQAELSFIPVNTLEQGKSLAETIIQELTAAQAHWQLLYAAMQEHDITSQKLEGNKKELEHNREQLKRTAEKLGTTATQKDASLRMLEKARVAAAENVEQLRAQLVVGEPCPVCGSTLHPFTTDNPQLDHVLAELESAFQQQEQAYLKTVADHSRLHQTCNQLENAIATLERDLVLREKQVHEWEKIWTGFSIHTAYAGQPMEKRTGLLQEQLQQQRDKQQQIQEQLKSFNLLQQQLEEKRNKRDGLDKQLTEIINNIKDTERVQQSLLEQLEHQTGEQQTAHNGLATVEQTISGYFTTEKWFQSWKNSPDTFVKRISDFAAEWKANVRALEDYVQSQAMVSVTLKSLQDQATHTTDEVTKKEQRLNNLSDEYGALSERRKQLFIGEPVSTVEAALKSAVDKARQALDQHRADREKLLETLTRTVTEKEQSEKDILTLQQQEGTSHKRIQQWLLNYNQQHETKLTEIELLQLLSFTTEWVEVERAALRVVEDALTKAQTILKEREIALEKHQLQRPSEKTYDELQNLLTEANAYFIKSSQEHSEIIFRLKEDAANKQKLGHLLQTIETKTHVVDNWAKLNDVIGSADGKKFRQIAQEYTLDVLLGYANIQLAILSKRYVLQRIPNTLGLQVIDQDMGNEVRTVYSLSGGESFLVSLALALGLASLSSTRMQVESLFIDEGFGSLDPNTLNIAMDALERLHNQGRKVGVISHVLEMTERIPVQIKVSKQQSGRSIVEIK